jgi:glycine cleavage system aminomethyltransferase T
MAVVEAGHASPGARVEVALGDETVGATVAPLPLYDTGKTRPRA